MPLEINKWKLNTSLEAKLNNRAVALEIQESVLRSVYRRVSQGALGFLYNNGFTEIHTPKLV